MDGEKMSKTKFEQFWIRQKETDYDGFSDWRVFKEGVWLENVEAVSKFIHVIEYSAFEKLKQDNAILIEALKFYASKKDLWISNADNWSDDIEGLYYDEGNTAREALKKIGVNE
jgi:hypothetical protein